MNAMTKTAIALMGALLTFLMLASDLTGTMPYSTLEQAKSELNIDPPAAD